MPNIHETAQGSVPAIGAPRFSPSTQEHWDRIRSTIVTNNAIFDASAPRLDVSHIARMSDQTIQDLMDQPLDPRPSKLRSTGPRTVFKNVPQVVAIGVGAMGAGIVVPAIFEDQSSIVSAQEPSAIPSAVPSLEPSQDPNIAKADPTCPPGMVPTKPEVSPSPTTLPEPSIPGNIGMLPNEGVLFSFLDGQNKTVTVSSQAQEAPIESAAPSAPASIAPESPAPTDPQTAAIDCEPDPMPSTMDALDQILNQKDKNIKKVTPKQIKNNMDKLWEIDPTIDTFSFPDLPQDDFSKEYMSNRLDALYNPKSDVRVSKAEIIIARFFELYDWVGERGGEKSVQIRKQILVLIDKIYDYSVTELTVSSRDSLKATLKKDITAITSFFIQ